MRNTVLVSLVAVVMAVAWVPPLFTGGACTAEFDAVSDQLQQARTELLTLRAALHYLAAHGMRYRTLTGVQCESAPPPDVVSCPEGTLLIGAVPVRNRVCRYYRDASVRFQLGFNRFAQLVRIQIDMNPYHKLRIPLADYELEMGR